MILGTMQFQLPPGIISIDLTSNHGKGNILTNKIPICFHCDTVILVVFCVVNMPVHVLFLEERDGTAVIVVGYVSHEVTHLENQHCCLDD